VRDGKCIMVNVEMWDVGLRGYGEQRRDTGDSHIHIHGIY
jgi:hypothetical protein